MNRELIEQRELYVDSLSNLSEPWINGVSYNPNDDAIKLAKHYLGILKTYATDREIYATLVIGPIPSGGVSIELWFIKDMITCNFKNSNIIDVEAYYNNDYVDLSYKDVKEFETRIKAQIDQILKEEKHGK